MSQSKIIALAGSTRRGSFNHQLVEIAALGARQAGAEVEVINLRDYPLPLFDQDLESAEGLPENARRLKSLFLASAGLLIASPEYNSSISGVLKNTIDWISRQQTETEPALACFRGKTAAILSASPGALGGMRGLVHLRAILGNIGVLVLPESVSISAAHEAFNESGGLKDERKLKQVQAIGSRLAEVCGKLAVA